MGLFRKGPRGTVCPECGLDARLPERLERHMKKAHGNAPQPKEDGGGSGGGLW